MVLSSWESYYMVLFALKLIRDILIEEINQLTKTLFIYCRSFTIRLFVKFNYPIYSMIQRSEICTSSLAASHAKNMDSQYEGVRGQIIASNYFRNAHKMQRLVIQSWILKLDQTALTAPLKRKRNYYAKILGLMCDCEVLIGPFGELPTMGDLPKMSKSQINSLIDEVQREVKSQGLGKSNTSSEKPQTFENIYANENSTSNSFKRSREDRLPHSRNKPKMEYFSVLEQSKEQQNSIQRKEYFSEMKNKQSGHESQGKQINKSFTILDANKQALQPKHLVITINTLNNKDSTPLQRSQSDWMGIDQRSNLDQCSVNDVRLLGQQQNYTLKTENIDFTLSNLGEDEELSALESQLSQRCRDKDRIPNYQYVTWKNRKEDEHPYSNFRKNKIRLTESIPSKTLIKSKVNASSYLTKGEESETVRSQFSLLSEFQYKSSRHSSESSLKDISSLIKNAQF